MPAKYDPNCDMCIEIRKTEQNDIGPRIVALERATLFIVQPLECILIARSHLPTLEAMREGERDLFNQNLQRAITAYSQVADAEIIHYDITQHAGHLYVRLTPHLPQRDLQAEKINTLVEDMREALGHLRVPLADPALQKYTDPLGRVKDWPMLRYPEEQMAVRRYLASKFQAGIMYTEREVNDILNRWHLFEDWALLRRELFMHGFLGRRKDGTAYWLVSYEPREQAS